MRLPLASTARGSSHWVAPACRFVCCHTASECFCGQRGRGSGVFATQLRPSGSSSSEAGQGGGLHVHTPLRSARLCVRRGGRGGGRRAGRRGRRPRGRATAASHTCGTAGCFGRSTRAVIDAPALRLTCLLRRPSPCALRRAPLTLRAAFLRVSPRASSHARGGRGPGVDCSPEVCQRRRLRQGCLAAGRSADAEQAVRQRARCKCVGAHPVLPPRQGRKCGVGRHIWGAPLLATPAGAAPVRACC